MAFKLKRLFKRTPHREGVRVVTSRGPVYGTYEDFSSNGVCLHLNSELKPDDVVGLDFSVPLRTLTRVRVVGRVAYCKPVNGDNAIGVQFISLNRAIQEEIDEIFDREAGPF